MCAFVSGTSIRSLGGRLLRAGGVAKDGAVLPSYSWAHCNPVANSRVLRVRLQIQKSSI
jgi:hypothetical protein